MAAYIIADIAEITDPASFQDYASKAGPGGYTLGHPGGRPGKET